MPSKRWYTNNLKVVHLVLVLVAVTPIGEHYAKIIEYKHMLVSLGIRYHAPSKISDKSGVMYVRMLLNRRNIAIKYGLSVNT